jgi:hypothetical protein
MQSLEPALCGLFFAWILLLPVDFSRSRQAGGDMKRTIHDSRRGRNDSAPPSRQGSDSGQVAKTVHAVKDKD